MNTEQKQRSKVCNELAVECYKILEPNLLKVAETLETRMEISHFLACLDNRLALSIALKFNAKSEESKS
jgi:hypothetical protein